MKRKYRNVLFRIRNKNYNRPSGSFLMKASVNVSFSCRNGYRSVNRLRMTFGRVSPYPMGVRRSVATPCAIRYFTTDSARRWERRMLYSSLPQCEGRRVREFRTVESVKHIVYQYGSRDRSQFELKYVFFAYAAGVHSQLFFMIQESLART